MDETPSDARREDDEASGDRKRALEELGEARARLRQMAEAAEGVFFLASLDAEVIHVGPGLAELWGLDVDPVRDGLELDVVHPEDRDRVAELVADPERAPYEVEYRIVRPDGEVRWMRQRGVQVEDAEGRPYRVAGWVVDVTEERESRRRLEETRRLLEKTVSSLEEAVIVTEPRDEGRVIRMVNPAAERIFGFSEGELLGMAPDDLHADPESAVSGRPWALEALEETGRFQATDPLRRKDGTVFEAEQTIIVLDRERGLEGRVLNVVRDVSERVRAEAEIRASEERFRQIAEHIKDVFWVGTVGKERMEYVSPAYRDVWGREPEELYEDPGLWLRSIVPEDRERVAESLPRQAEGGWEEEYRIERPDGELRWIWDRAFPVEGPDGEVVRIVGVAEDITERTILEERFLQSQKMEAVGRLAGGIAHDFNNLLTVIRSQTDLLLMDLDPSSPLREEVEAIQGSADRAARLTSQLLAFSRDQVLRPRPVDLSAVVRGMGALLERIIGEDVAIVQELSDGLPAVRIDPGHLEQAILNLAVNARDAMPHGGVLTLTTAREEVTEEVAEPLPGLEPGDYVLLRVADTGSGMDEEVRRRIFEPFFTTKATGKGTGLGMAMVYGFVKQSGGAIHVDSEPGVGTTVSLRFPFEEAEAERLDAPEPGAFDDIRALGRVLVVEDDPDVRRVTARILRRAGLDVTAVEDAESGREELQQDGAYALVLTDLVLPGTSGRALVDHLLESRPDLRIVVMSGYAEDSPGHRGDLPEEVAFIQKPFTPDALVKVVRETLARS